MYIALDIKIFLEIFFLNIKRVLISRYQVNAKHKKIYKHLKLMGFSTVFQEFFLNCTSVIVHCRARQLSYLGCFPWKKRKKKIEWSWRLQKGPTKSHFFASRFHSHDTSGTKKNLKVARDGHKIAENRNKILAGQYFQWNEHFNWKNIT